MIDNFSSKFDQAYSEQLYRRFCTEDDHRAYSERYLSDPAEETDIQQESVERTHQDSEPF